MEEIKHISEAVFNWVFRGIIAVMTFVVGWNIRLQRDQNKTGKELAVNSANDESRDRSIAQIENSVKQIRHDVKTITLCVQDQKEMYIATENQRRQQAKIIKELLE